MTTTPQASSRRKSSRRAYFTFRATTVRSLSIAAIGGLWSYFFLKLSFGKGLSATALVASGALLIGALLCAALVFLSTYSFISHAPDREIDERELAQRYRAHFHAFQYTLGGLILGPVITEAVGKIWKIVPSVGILSNFIFTMTFTSLIMPAALLAFWDDEP